MSTLQVTTITSSNTTEPLILRSANSGGGQIVLNSANNDVQFIGPLRFTANVVGDGSGLTLPSSNVANAAYTQANNAYDLGTAVLSLIFEQSGITDRASTTANAAFTVANAGFGRANTALQNTSGTFAGTLNLTGSFGLGVSSPSYTIDGLTSTNSLRFRNTANNNQAAVFRFNAYGTEEFSITATRDATGNTQSLILAGQDSTRLYTAGAERMRIDANGNVGIDTTSPRAKLHVASDGTAITNTLGNINANNSLYITNSDGLYGLVVSSSGSGRSFLQSQRTDGTATAYDICLNPLGGNIGIGTTSPSSINSFYSGLHIAGNTATSLKLTNSTTGSSGSDGFDLLVAANSSDAYLWQRENAPLIFGTNATERMRIESSGSIISGKPRYTFVNTGGTAGYVYLGRWSSAGQAGAKLKMTITSATGYNADTNQNQITEVYFKVSNGSSFRAGSTGNFFADGIIFKYGPQINAPGSIRVVSIDASTYDIYGNFGAFTGDFSFYEVSVSWGVWTHSGTWFGTSSPSGNWIDLTTNFFGTLDSSSILQNANAIKFPATQVASADANTLDDYEEGSWTPVWRSSGTLPTLSYATQVGRYVKIGRVVNFWGRIFMNSWGGGGGSGNIGVGGLPFTSTNDGLGLSLCHVVFTYTGGNAVWPTGATQVFGQIQQGSTYFDYLSLGVPTTGLGEGGGRLQWTSNPQMYNNYFSGTYNTD